MGAGGLGSFSVVGMLLGTSSFVVLLDEGTGVGSGATVAIAIAVGVMEGDGIFLVSGVTGGCGVVCSDWGESALGTGCVASTLPGAVDTGDADLTVGCEDTGLGICCGVAKAGSVTTGTEVKAGIVAGTL